MTGVRKRVPVIFLQSSARCLRVRLGNEERDQTCENPLHKAGFEFNMPDY
jgi:hypothetical protein